MPSVLASPGGEQLFNTDRNGVPAKSPWSGGGLKTQQTDIADLLARGDEFAAAADARAAVAFYQAALKSASQSRSLEPATLSRLRGAQSYVQARVSTFERTVDDALRSVIREDGVASLRLAHAVDMLKGGRQIFPQQPSVFYYPYLAPRQFFEREEFDWVEDLEAATGDILDELQALLSDSAQFQPYVENAANRPVRDFHGLNGSHAWTALYVWKNGSFVPEIGDRCPATVRAMGKVPLAQIGERTPSVFFSRLQPGAHIPPHTGMLNSRLICHLPLIVPSGGWLRVGNETRSWKPGELLIFDDSIEHEAKNGSEQMRIVLIFEIWRPELSDAERAAISQIFDAIDQLGGVAQE